MEAEACQGRYVGRLAAHARVAERTAAVERPVGGAETRPAVRTRLVAVGGDQAEPRRPEHDPCEADIRHADPVHALPLNAAMQHRVQIGTKRAALAEPPGRASVHRQPATSIARRRVPAAERTGVVTEAVFQATAPVVDGVVERVESGLVAERHAVVLGVVGRAEPPEGQLDSQFRLVVPRQPVQVVEAEPERVGGAEAALVVGPFEVEIDAVVASLLQDRPAAAVRLEVALQSEWGRREHLLDRRVQTPTADDVGAVDRTARWRHCKGAHQTRQQTPRAAACGGNHLDDTVYRQAAPLVIMTSRRSSRLRSKRIQPTQTTAAKDALSLQ